MCGLSCFIEKKSSNYNKTEIIKKMNDLIIHRGPDNGNEYIDSNIALGHRRLAIIDLYETANQPFKNDKYILIFNGEIYNYKEIKKDLVKYNYVTESDTEVILAAYQKWGSECVQHFRGMWAFILYDIEKEIVFCSRDRFGIKPLYYYEEVKYMAFASEIKQFTVLPSWEATGNLNRIHDFLIFGVLDHTDETMFKNVKQLRPGSNLVYDLRNNEYTIHQYYNLEDKINEVKIEKENSEQLKSLLIDSIKEHMIADVSIGSCLSGGLDSSTIVMLMDENSDKRTIDTFSSCFDQKKYDEQEYIDEVNNKTNSREHKIYPNVKNLLKELDDLIWHQDEPFGSTSIFAQRVVFSEANNENIKVILDGQGADEQLAGYSSFYIAYLNELHNSGRDDLFEIELETLIENYPYYTRETLMNLTLKSDNTKLKEELMENINREGRFNKPIFHLYYDYYKEFNAARQSLKDFSLHQIYKSSLPALLHYEDRNSMTYSIESRVPFLDHRIVEFVVACESSEKIKNSVSKLILRKAMENILPQSILERKDKMGFVTPEVMWIRENKSIFREYFDIGCEKLEKLKLLDRSLALSWFDNVIEADKEFDFTIWRIICIGKWMDIFKVMSVY